MVEYLRVFRHVGFFLDFWQGASNAGSPPASTEDKNIMEKSLTSMAKQVARAASEFQRQRTGHTPQSVTAVLSGDALMVPPPKPGVGPRRIWSDSKGLLWVSFWHSGEVARFDPIAKAWKVWSVPKSKTGCYAVYVDDKDKVWLSDWVANEIMRFDPATEKFESYPSNKRGALVRQLQGRPGEIWGAESGTDRLVVVRD